MAELLELVDQAAGVGLGVGATLEPVGSASTQPGATLAASNDGDTSKATAASEVVSTALG